MTRPTTPAKEKYDYNATSIESTHPSCFSASAGGDGVEQETGGGVARV